MWAQTKESQEKITPAKALEFLKEGNNRFLKNLKAKRDLVKQVKQTAEGQFPFATILSCIDSRTSSELIFDLGIGDIISIRIAGNILNDDILGSMEYACGVANSKIVVVLGHTKCGAIISACNNYQWGYFTGLLGKVKPAIELENLTKADRNGKNHSYVNNVTKLNVNLTINQIRRQSQILRNLEEEGKIQIVGGIYDVDNGSVAFFD